MINDSTERWYWIELIGFDNEAEDFGVDAFLSECVSVTGVSLLFSHIDFIFNESENLAPTACSYYGHEYNRMRRRQDWTRTQLCGLVSTLKARGIKVFFSSFDMTYGIKDPDWLSYGRSGGPEKLIYVLKRIGNRTVGEVVVEKIADTLDYYGFDGLHLADGLSSNRLSIENGDFSLSFCKASGIDIPEKFMIDSVDCYTMRRKWILDNKRMAWTEYLSDCWAEFYDKLFSRIKKPIIFNNAWTRDSFEALYRYGIDYRRCKIDEAYAIMIEENSATRAITATEDEGGVSHTLEERDAYTYEYALMQQNIRLVTKGLKQITLLPISDTMEQWDAIRHCPTELARAIVKRGNNFVYRNGKLESCNDAPLYCLSDGVPGEDWRWLARQESYRIPVPTFIDGFAAVVNPDALDTELELYLQSKRYFGSSLMLELVSAGLNLSAQLALDEVSSFSLAKCLLVTNLAAYSDEEKKRLIKAQIPILAVGEDVELPMEKCAYYRGGYVSVALYGATSPLSLESLCEFDKIIAEGEAVHGEIWTEPLSHRRIENCFFGELSRIMSEYFALDVSCESGIKLNSFFSGNDKYILLSNDKHTYFLPHIKTSVEPLLAEAMMKDKGYRVKTNGNSFVVRIPPRCAEIVRIKCEDK